MTDSKFFFLLLSIISLCFTVNMKEDEMKKSCEYTKLSYNEFMDIMLNNIAKNRKTKNGIIFESGKFGFNNVNGYIMVYS